MYISKNTLIEQGLYLKNDSMGTGTLSSGVQRPECGGDYLYIALVKTEGMWAQPEHCVRNVLINIG